MAEPLNHSASTETRPVLEEGLGSHLNNARAIVQNLRDQFSPDQFLVGADWETLDGDLAAIDARLAKAAALARESVYLRAIDNPYVVEQPIAPPGAAVIARDVFTEDEPTAGGAS